MYGSVNERNTQIVLYWSSHWTCLWVFLILFWMQCRLWITCTDLYSTSCIIGRHTARCVAHLKTYVIKRCCGTTNQIIGSPDTQHLSIKTVNIHTSLLAISIFQVRDKSSLIFVVVKGMMGSQRCTVYQLHSVKWRRGICFVHVALHKPFLLTFSGGIKEVIIVCVVTSKFWLVCYSVLKTFPAPSISTTKRIIIVILEKQPN